MGRVARRRARAGLAAALLMAWSAGSPAAPPPRDTVWDHSRHWTSLATFATAFGVSAGLRLGHVHPAGAAFGPSFDRTTGQLSDPQLTSSVDREFVQRQAVSTPELIVMGLSTGLIGVLTLSAAGDRSTDVARARRDQRLLDASMSFLETMGGTLLITEVLKYSVGRLRPDFLDRYQTLGCADDPDSGPCITGQLSFVSGHSSIAFAGATWASLVLGGELVWGPALRGEADAGTMTLGIVSQVALLGLASYIASTRISDNRHHVTDVVGGALIGAAVANASYWSYFRADGHSRNHGAIRPDVSAGRDALMFSVSGGF